jgi:hypothetical protein
VNLQPVSVALKFGFIGVMYLFLLWVSRSAVRDLRRSSAGSGADLDTAGTGMYTSVRGAADIATRAPRLVVVRARGHEPGMIYDLDGEAVLGRGAQADIRLDDPFASSRHARLFPQGHLFVLEDLASTNGTYLNEELLDGPRPLRRGDRLRIGECEFTYDA